MSDEPKCPACGIAWRRHLGTTAMCRQMQRAACQCNGRADTIRRLLEEIERLRSERDTLKTACHKNKRKWKRGWGKTLEQIIRGWQRACNEKDSEIERLKAEVDRSKLSSSAPNGHDYQDGVHLECCRQCEIERLRRHLDIFQAEVECLKSELRSRKSLTEVAAELGIDITRCSGDYQPESLSPLYIDEQASD